MGAGTKAPISRRALQNRVHLFVCYLCLVALGVSDGAGQTAWPRLPCLVLTLMQFSQVDMYWSKKQQVHPYIARSLQIFVAKGCLPGCINRSHLCHLCFRSVSEPLPRSPWIDLQFDAHFLHCFPAIVIVRPDGRQYCGEPELLRTAIRRCRHYLLSFWVWREQILHLPGMSLCQVKMNHILGRLVAQGQWSGQWTTAEVAKVAHFASRCNSGS